MPLISTDWSLQPMTEQYLCVRQTLQSDMWISSISPVSPTGTHHQVLMVTTATPGQPLPPDGVTVCSSELSSPSLYASGVGTSELDLPVGVAIHLQAGQQLFLNLHLFNAGDAQITGTSGVTYMPIDPSDVQHEAGVVLAGKAQGLEVDVGVGVQQTGTCTTNTGTTIFAAAPHMHLLGTHLTATYTPPNGGTSVTLIDQPYLFDAQNYIMQSPEIVTEAGGKYTITCTYDNESGSPVYFGESTTDEMCFALTMIYPPPPQTECTK